MTKEELAKRIEGREIGNEITPAEEKLAKEAGLVVIFGASDDLCELRGAIYDEVNCPDGGEVLIGKDGQLVEIPDDDDMAVLRKYNLADVVTGRAAIKVKALWCATRDLPWSYETDFPHANFDVMEDGETYCIGIVIDLKDMEK